MARSVQGLYSSRAPSVGLGTEALLLEAVSVVDRHVQDAVTRGGDHGLELLVGRRPHPRVFAPNVLRERIAHGSVVARFQPRAAGAAQRAHLDDLLVHPFFPSPPAGVSPRLSFLGLSPLPNPFGGALVPEVSLPVASLLVPVFALAQLPESSARLGAGDTDQRVFEGHSMAL